jgi:hypothetical protein
VGLPVEPVEEAGDGGGSQSVGDYLAALSLVAGSPASVDLVLELGHALQRETAELAWFVWNLKYCIFLRYLFILVGLKVEFKIIC